MKCVEIKLWESSTVKSELFLVEFKIRIPAIYIFHFFHKQRVACIKLWFMLIIIVLNLVYLQLYYYILLLLMYTEFIYSVMKGAVRYKGVLF